jgi:hypothetical protein
MVEVKAKAEFDAQTGKLTVNIELLPATELVHEMLAALLDEDEAPKVSVEYTNVRDVISSTLTFSSDRDIVKIGKAGLDLKLEARDRGLTIDALVAKKNADAAKLVKAAKARAGQAE